MAAASSTDFDDDEDDEPTQTRPHLALTTIFTPPASCTDMVTYDGETLWQNRISQRGDPACYPASFYSVVRSYYSPGICPHMWTSAGQIDHLSGNDAMCCPTSYLLSSTSASVLANFCFSIMTTSLTNVYSVESLSRGAIPRNPRLVTLRKTDVDSTTVYADVIQIQWQNSDNEITDLMKQKAAMTASSSASTPPQTSTAASSTNGVSSVTSATSTHAAASTPPSSSGLSAGAKVGIGVGVPLAVITLAAIGAFLIMLRQRRRRDAAITDDFKGPSSGEIENELEGPAPPAEMDATPIGELHGTGVPVELNNRDRKSDPHASSSTNPGGYLGPGNPATRGAPGFTPMGSQKYSRSPPVPKS